MDLVCKQRFHNIIAIVLAGIKSILDTISKVSVFLVRIQFECGKIPTRKTPNVDTFHALGISRTSRKLLLLQCKTIFCIYIFLLHLIDITEAAVRRCSIIQGVLRNFAKLTGEHLCQSLFFDKFQASACNFIKDEALTQAFSCEFCEISKNTLYYRTPPVAASYITQTNQQKTIIPKRKTWECGEKRMLQKCICSMKIISYYMKMKISYASRRHSCFTDTSHICTPLKQKKKKFEIQKPKIQKITKKTQEKLLLISLHVIEILS